MILLLLKMYIRAKIFIVFLKNILIRRLQQLGNQFSSHSKSRHNNWHVFTIRDLHRYGYNGTSCVLRTICETAELPFHRNNGVFGNIFHILFT